MKRVIILDFDDTITDNRQLDFMAFRNPCKKLNLNYPNKIELLKFRKKGMLAHEIFLLKNNHHKNKLSEFLKLRKIFLNSNESIKNFKLKKNLLDFLEFIKKKKIKLFLCTANSNPKIVKQFLEYHNIENYFSDLYFLDRLNFSIPNTTKTNRILIKSSLLHKILIDLNVKTSSIVFIGNSIEDFNASLVDNIPFIYFKNIYQINEIPNLKTKTNNFEQLVQIIDKDLKK